MHASRLFAVLVAGAFLVGLVGCGDDHVGEQSKEVIAKGGKTAVLTYTDLDKGKGEEVKKLDYVAVHYTGKLTNGTKFDSSRDRNKPFVVQIGTGQVIQGWDEGIPGMKVGGKRMLYIPPELGYGDRDMGKIKPNSKLIFEVEVVRILTPEEAKSQID